MRFYDIKRTLSFLLAVLLAASATACGGDTTTETSSVSDDTTTAPISEEPQSGVPLGTDLKGETVRIWYSSASNQYTTYTDLVGDASGDIVDSTIFVTISAIEEDLNVELDFVDTGVDPGNTGNSILKLIMADDTEYDLFNFVQYSGAHHISQGIFYNVADSEYLSFDQPWWDSEYMKAMTVGEDKLYLLVGDAAIDRTRFSACLFFNTDMMTDMGVSPDTVYDQVLEGTWTLDQMKKLSSDAWRNLNNSGKIDEGDIFGYLSNGSHNIDALFYSQNIHATSRDQNDIPKLDMMNEKIVDVADQVYRFFFESNGAMAIETSITWFNTQFTNGNSMFLIGNFYNADAFREMKQNFGFLPIPKADESQENYITVIHNAMRDYALPANCQKPDTVTAVLEELAFRTNRDVLPTYVESTLKVKYTRDEKSVQMIDIIRENSFRDFAYVYTIYTDEIALIMRKMIKQSNNAFASLYDSKRPAAETAMETLIDSFLNSAN